MTSIHLDAGIQVVILARGRSIKLETLTDDCPKPLLPVANRPLITYQINELHSIGIKDFTIACTHSDVALIKPFLEDCYGTDINFSFLEIPAASNTLTCLKKLVKARKGAAQPNKGVDQLVPTITAQSDVLLVNCTSIIESPCYAELLMLHRRKRSNFTMLLAKQPPPVTDPGVVPPPPDPDYIPDTIGLDEVTGRLVHFVAGIDVMSKISIPRTVLSSAACGGNINIHTDYNDVRAYVLSHEVLDFVKKCKKPDFTSFGGDIIPFLLRCQFFPEDAAKLPCTAKKKAEFKDFERSSEKRAKRHKLEFTQMDACDSHSSRSLSVMSDWSCYALVVDSVTVTCQRANTKVQYMACNKLIASGKSTIKPWEALDKNRFISTSAQIDPKTNVSPESVVGDSNIAAMCGIRKSIIGKNCIIHAGAKVTNSVLMDGVVVMEKAVISDSILCNGVHVDSGVSVKGSQVGAGFCVTRDLDNESVSTE